MKYKMSRSVSLVNARRVGALGSVMSQMLNPPAPPLPLPRPPPPSTPTPPPDPDGTPSLAPGRCASPGARVPACARSRWSLRPFPVSPWFVSPPTLAPLSLLPPPSPPPSLYSLPLKRVCHSTGRNSTLPNPLPFSRSSEPLLSWLLLASEGPPPPPPPPRRARAALFPSLRSPRRCLEFNTTWGGVDKKQKEGNPEVLFLRRTLVKTTDRWTYMQ